MSEQEPQVPPPETPQAPGAGAPPSGQAAWAPQGPSGPRASFGRRLAAYLIDTVVFLVVFIVLAVALDTAGVVIAFLFGLAYFPYFEGGRRGQTPGKMVLDIRVVDASTGGPIGYGRGVVRYLGKILSGIPCYLGYLWMLWDREKQTWHDKLSTSVVVPTEYYPVT